MLASLFVGRLHLKFPGLLAPYPLFVLKICGKVRICNRDRNIRIDKISMAVLPFLKISGYVSTSGLSVISCQIVKYKYLRVSRSYVLETIRKNDHISKTVPKAHGMTKSTIFRFTANQTKN